MKKYEEIELEKVKNIWKTASPEQKEDLVKKYISKKHMEEAAEKDHLYAIKVSDKLAKIEYYENHIQSKSRRLINSEKIFSAVPTDLDSLEKEYKRSADLNNFYDSRKDELENAVENFYVETFPNYKKMVEDVGEESNSKEIENVSEIKDEGKNRLVKKISISPEINFNRSVQNLANRLEEKNYFGRFEDPQILLYLSQVFKEEVKTISPLEKFSVPEVDNKYLGKKLKEIQKGKNEIDRKVVLDNKKGFFYKPVKFISDKVFGNLETKLNEQKSKLGGFGKEIESVSKNLKENKEFLMDGFDNLCNYWMKADSLANDYSNKIEMLRDERKNTSLFSWGFLKTFRKEKILSRILGSIKKE